VVLVQRDRGVKRAMVEHLRRRERPRRRIEDRDRVRGHPGKRDLAIGKLGQCRPGEPVHHVVQHAGDVDVRECAGRWIVELRGR
jgi:hypothetical protein